MSQVDQLRSLIDDSGLLLGFTDINQASQPAPILQLEYLDEKKLAERQGDRFVFIGKTSNNGSPTPTLYDEREMIVVVFSKGGTLSVSDRRITANYAEQISNFLLIKYRKKSGNNCIASVRNKGVSGIFRNGDGRFVYEIRLTVKFGSNVNDNISDSEIAFMYGTAQPLDRIVNNDWPQV